MSILVVGSVAIDNIETPAGSRSRILGGACTYFATAASLYAQVRMVGVVGADFPPEHLRFLQSRNIDLRGLQVVEGETFSWSGRYGHDLGDAETLDTRLNVFADFHPALPEEYRSTPYVFLANIDPELQIEVLSQMDSPRLTALDSMNFWMSSKREALTRAMQQVDVVLLNEAEVIQYASEPNLIVATQAILDLGPRALVVKRGRYGAMLVTRGASIGERFFLTPAYPLEHVVDPTGAGDTFAAGFMGYLAQTGDLSVAGLRRAVVHGTLVASFTVQDFSIDALRNLTLADVVTRYDDFALLTHYDDGACPGRERLQRPIAENRL